MICAVHQPQYLPWLGYFDKIDRADVFVLLDTVQYKKNEWQNRNRIKTANGPQWLTVPVCFRYPQLIQEVEINNRERWQHKHWQALKTNYARAPYWDFLKPFFEEILDQPWEKIAPLNITVVRRLCELLGIETPIHIASELGTFPEDPDERLIAITRHFGADTYLAGSGGYNYMNLDAYRSAGIKVIFQEFRHPVYRQLFSDEFISHLSVIDLVFNHGPESLNIIRSTRN
ncbi:MAG TPA: WbqC family protein [Syntrophales bacterium]|nr:WbqC family protein [Syntrophales bacterium]HOL59242.1 WbqC family protein [Syntrophales bacterium]HPO35292.1 WbqC family protein [Syntrophales bacterium]